MNKSCTILLPVLFLSGVLFGQQLTYYKDVEPIIVSKCTACHQPGKSAPFSLLTYNDVTRHSAMVGEVISTGYMPPWKADTAYSHFANERVLTALEINTITTWVKQEMPKGEENNSKIIQPSPAPAEVSADLVVQMNEAFVLPATNTDTVVYFRIPFHIASDTNVVAFEFVPGNAAVVHHSNAWVFAKEDAKVLDTFWQPMMPRLSMPLPMPGIALVRDSLRASLPDYFPEVKEIYCDGWVPGATARWWPKGFGFRLPKDGFIVLQVHYAPTPVAEKDQSRVNIFFTDQPITRQVSLVNIGSGGGIAEPEPELLLPPGSIRSFEIKTVATTDISYLSFNPHMHYLGKQMKVFAVTPCNDTIKLVAVNDWDFRWQEFYVPQKIIKIPEGSVITVQASFDNTNTNAANRFKPAKLVKQGANTTDEMMSVIILQVPYLPGDENILLTPAGRKEQELNSVTSSSNNKNKGL